MSLKTGCCTSAKAWTDARLPVALLIVLCLLLPGCIRQTPVITDIPLPTPTPYPDIRQELIYPDEQKDALGKEIIFSDTHYVRYINLKNLRVYEYGGGTFLDGICENTYPEPLFGGFQAAFFDEDGALIAQAALYFDEDEHRIPPGQTRIFATIDTDMRVEHLPLTLISTQPVTPESGEEG